MLEQVRGAGTGVSLEDMTPLLLPWARDPWGALRPPVSLEAMRMSAELASATYQMAIEPWLQAGWRDVTIQVDNELVTDFIPSHRAGAMQKLTATWRMHRVRSKLRQRNPLGQMAGALRQIKGSDTGKALVMIHPATPGRYVVAVSFMGTGSRFYDWFSNFRMSSEEGVHRGFLQLARQFEGNEERILFPATARELGLEKLTLRSILEEAAHPDSRFTLWLSGHSQGGALMQVWAYHKLREDGVLPRNMVGYGFASPSALSARAVEHPEAFPLYHVLNSDDLVPRMGAQVHLGMCLDYPTDLPLRSQCYAWPRDAQSAAQRRALYPLVLQMTDTGNCLLMAMAYLDALTAQPPEAVAAGLRVLGADRVTPGKLLQAADDRMDAVLRFFCRRLAAAYASITGRVADPRAIARRREAILKLMGQMGVAAFSETLTSMMRWPHSIQCRRGAAYSPYMYIVRYGVDRLRPFIWQGGETPRRCYAGAAEAETPATRGIAGLTVRRRVPAIRHPRQRRRYSQTHPRRDTRRRPLPTCYGGRRPGETLIHVKE